MYSILVAQVCLSWLEIVTQVFQSIVPVVAFWFPYHDTIDISSVCYRNWCHFVPCVESRTILNYCKLYILVVFETSLTYLFSGCQLLSYGTNKLCRMIWLQKRQHKDFECLYGNWCYIVPCKAYRTILNYCQVVNFSGAWNESYTFLFSGYQLLSYGTNKLYKMIWLYCNTLINTWHIWYVAIPKHRHRMPNLWRQFLSTSGWQYQKVYCCS